MESGSAFNRKRDRKVSGRSEIDRHNGSLRRTLHYIRTERTVNAVFVFRHFLTSKFFINAPSTAHSIESETGKFQRSADGWKDVWSFLDRTLAEIENAEYLDGIRFVKEAGVKYGQYTKDGQIADTYPYFYAWASCAPSKS